MHIRNLKEFDRYLESRDLARVHLIFCPDDFERRQTIDKLLLFLTTNGEKPVTISPPFSSISPILQALNSFSLFSSKTIVVADGLDKKLIDELAKEWESDLDDRHLIIGSQAKSNAHWKIKTVTLDLVDEKPWEKEKRWAMQLIERAKEEGKELSKEAAEWIVESLDRDASLHSTELEKVLCYCAEKPTIDRSDVLTVGAASRSHAAWQMADAIVWEKIFTQKMHELKDSSFFYALLAALRQQYEIGVRMHYLMQNQIPLSEWTHHFPRLWPKTIEKRAEQCRNYGLSYFRENLDRLFEVEYLAKGTTIPTDILFDYIRLKQLSMR